MHKSLYLFRGASQICATCLPTRKIPLHLRTLDAEVLAGERERQRISHDLHDGLGQLLGGIALDPAVPAHVPFAVSLAKLATETERLFRGVGCRFTGDPAFVIESHHTAQHLFRIAQEAINNAIRHGRATRVEIGIGADAREIHLEVRDNGIGVAQRKFDSGIGIRIMKHRANALGGTLDILPGKTGGTLVQCRVPLTPPPST